MITEKEHEVSQYIPPERRDRKWVGGVALILIGTILLLATFTSSELLGELILPVLGVIFLVWGITARRPGPMVPGGILTGLGVGVVLAQQVFTLSTTDESGLITLCLGLGFLLIPLFCALFTPRWHWWPTIPGGILVVAGAALLIGNDTTVLEKIWPLGFIIAGVIILWQVLRRRETR